MVLGKMAGWCSTWQSVIRFRTFFLLPLGRKLVAESLKPDNAETGAEIHASGGK